MSQRLNFEIKIGDTNGQPNTVLRMYFKNEAYTLESIDTMKFVWKVLLESEKIKDESFQKMIKDFEANPTEEMRLEIAKILLDVILPHFRYEDYSYIELSLEARELLGYPTTLSSILEEKDLVNELDFDFDFSKESRLILFEKLSELEKVRPGYYEDIMWILNNLLNCKPNYVGITKFELSEVKKNADCEMILDLSKNACLFDVGYCTAKPCKESPKANVKILEYIDYDSLLEFETACDKAEKTGIFKVSCLDTIFEMY